MTMQPLTIALPKGRILDEVAPMLGAAGIVPEAAFFDDAARQLVFGTNRVDVRLIRVRSFDVATFVAFGAAQIGVCGSDVLMEYDYSELYAPLDLKIGKCRISIAAPEGWDDAPHWRSQSHVRIATKYPHATKEFFARAGVQAECIKLNGAMEIAPMLGLSQYIVDLVSSGATLKANGLKELEVIAEVSSRLIVGRAAFKTQSARLEPVIEAFAGVVGA
jgi:ATP phosphoribosyltransferase